jgi:hypothetical protein
MADGKCPLWHRRGPSLHHSFEGKTMTFEGKTTADLPQPTAKALASRKNGARSRGPRSAAG